MGPLYREFLIFDPTLVPFDPNPDPNHPNDSVVSVITEEGAIFAKNSFPIYPQVTFLELKKKIIHDLLTSYLCEI